MTTISKTIPLIFLTDDIAFVTLSDHISGNDLEYSYMSQDNPLTTIIDGIVQIQGGYRDMVYNIEVIAKKIQGIDQIKIIIPVEEDAKQPVVNVNNLLPEFIFISKSEYTINLDNHFENGVKYYTFGVYDSENILYTNSGIQINGGNNSITLPGNLMRDLMYEIRISARNNKYFVNAVLQVIEDKHPPVAINNGLNVIETTIALGNGGTHTYYKLIKGEIRIDLTKYYLGDDLIFEVVQNVNVYDNVSIFGNELILNGDYRDTTYYVQILVYVENLVNVRKELNIFLNIIELIHPPVSLKELGFISILKNTVLYNLDEYFDYIINKSLYIYYIDGTELNANEHTVYWGQGNNLFVKGNSRNQTYNIRVTIQNPSGTIYSILMVTEYPPAPTLVNNGFAIFGKYYLGMTPLELNLSEYFTSTVEYSITTSSPLANVTLQGSIMKITGSMRHINYNVTVKAFNITGDISSILDVTEFPLRQS